MFENDPPIPLVTILIKCNYGMEFGKSANASPTSVKECSSRPVLLVASSAQVTAGFLLYNEFMDATSYGCSSFISAKACSRAA
jgi:hypothetical protein